jgi:hypothetical protein
MAYLGIFVFQIFFKYYFSNIKFYSDFIQFFFFFNFVSILILYIIQTKFQKTYYFNILNFSRNCKLKQAICPRPARRQVRSTKFDPQLQGRKFNPLTRFNNFLLENVCNN